MSKKFSWEVEKTSLILRVTDGVKETTWRIRKNTPQWGLVRLFEELQRAMWTTEPVEPIVPAAVANEELVEQAESNYQYYGTYDTEEASREALRAKAEAVATTDGKWWEKTDMAQLDLYVIGHGDEED